ncbi:hypothetical protein CJ030_MR2G019943 [Morella rubra]|uniref:Uncharacterized protein n=1 Tax=Morella rubra TaxID=262757 RepID=A0A6A1WBL0_9ROSI|nr:hypothetical protein CJ030_MR2G019943 [Morella rubra]
MSTSSSSYDVMLAAGKTARDRWLWARSMLLERNLISRADKPEMGSLALLEVLTSPTSTCEIISTDDIEEAVSFLY